ncbi:hypothetical protein [Streptomyces sp. NBC_00669]|uniref:hypothetical protein n=1 Tax=Streptomyces sp. NBC_00669 TaxID=2976011 RepID=UPI003FA7EDB0
MATKSDNPTLPTQPDESAAAVEGAWDCPCPSKSARGSSNSGRAWRRSSAVRAPTTGCGPGGRTAGYALVRGTCPWRGGEPV